MLGASVKSRWHFVTIPAEVRADLQYWREWLPTWSGSMRWPQIHRSSVQVYTDASTEGFGVFVAEDPDGVLPGWLSPGSGFAGVWSPADVSRCSRQTGIAWSEMFAVLAALWLLAPSLAGRRLVVHVDNSAVAAALVAQRTRSPRLTGLMRAIAALCHVFRVELCCEALLGVDNAVADLLSRPALHRFSPHPSLTLARPVRCVSLLRSSLVPRFRPT